MTPEGKLKAQQLPVILDLCSWKTWARKSNNYGDAIVLQKLRFQNVFCPYENEKLLDTSVTHNHIW